MPVYQRFRVTTNHENHVFKNPYKSRVFGACAVYIFTGDRQTDNYARSRSCENIYGIPFSETPKMLLYQSFANHLFLNRFTIGTMHDILSTQTIKTKGNNRLCLKQITPGTWF